MIDGRLYGLDALRGVAAIVVVFGHIAHVFGTGWFVGNFGLAVDFFFMLSGYVMARTYERRMKEGLSAFSFMRLRYRRLFWPSAIGATLAFMPVIAYGVADLLSIAAYASALLFLPFPFWNGLTFPLNSVRWSLFGEMLANLVHVLVFARLGTKHLLAVVLLLTIPLATSVHHTGIWPIPRFETGLFLPGLARTMIPYIIGILIFRHVQDREIRAINAVTLSVIFAASILVWGLLPGKTFNLLFVFVACPVFIILGSSIRLSKIGRNWARAAGDISYPLYAVHMPILLTLSAFVTAGQATFISVSLIAAALIWRANPTDFRKRALTTR